MITCLLFGVPLVSDPTSLRQRVVHSIVYVTLFAVMLVSRLAYSYDKLTQVKLGFVDVVIVIHLVFGFIALFVFARKRSDIVKFLTSLGHSSVIALHRKLDLLCLLFSLVPIVADFLGELAEMRALRSELKDQFDFIWLFEGYNNFNLGFIFFLFAHFHFELMPICVTLYSFGYYALYAQKVQTLNCISKKFSSHIDQQELSINYNSVMCELEAISEEQELFESTFGPFLFIALCNYFTANLNSIAIMCNLLLLRKKSIEFPGFYYSLAHYLFDQAVCVGLIFFVSLFNGRLRKMSTELFNQLRSNLNESQSMTFLMVNLMENKIHNSINEPLTAWKVVTLDRKVILTIATSCVTFSVLILQIDKESSK